MKNKIEKKKVGAPRTFFSRFLSFESLESLSLLFLAFLAVLTMYVHSYRTKNTSVAHQTTSHRGRARGSLSGMAALQSRVDFFFKRSEAKKKKKSSPRHHNAKRYTALREGMHASRHTGTKEQLNTGLFAPWGLAVSNET